MTPLSGMSWRTYSEEILYYMDTHFDIDFHLPDILLYTHVHVVLCLHEPKM